MPAKIGEVTAELMETRINDVREAISELEDNMTRLFDPPPDDDIDEAVMFAQGDAYEIEQRVERLCQDARHVAETVEAGREDE